MREQIMMREEYASIRATPSLVGREDILSQIREAIQVQSPVPYVFYITAPGGWGKTRLVDAILKKFDTREGGEWASPEILSASRLVDLYHTYTHSDEGLIDDIVKVLDAENGSRFENYINQRAELDRVKHDLSQILRAVTQQRTKMMDAFVNDFNNTNSQFEKVVLAFDTLIFTLTQGTHQLVHLILQEHQAIYFADLDKGQTQFRISQFLYMFSGLFDFLFIRLLSLQYPSK